MNYKHSIQNSMFEFNCLKELSQQKSDSPEINTNHLKSQFELRPNSWTIELVPALPDEEKRAK